MSPVDGYIVLQKLKDKLETSVISFVFITSLAKRSNIRKEMESGADDYLTKPFTRDELLRTVKARLNRINLIKDRIHLFYRNAIMALPREMNTPLNTILGLSQIIRESKGDCTPEELEGMGKLIVDSANRLYDTLNQFLIFVDPEAHKDFVATKLPSDPGKPY